MPDVAHGPPGPDVDRVLPYVERHIALFNNAVRSGDFDAFLATFADDATMRFEGVPAGPFAGRDAIAAAYRADPPDDTMRLVSISPVPGGVLVRFAWQLGGGGFFIIGFHDAEVTRLDVSFLPEAESAWTT